MICLRECTVSIQNALPPPITYSPLFTRAAKFDVTVDFLFQQVTYLTDRHTSQVRAQMRKVQAAARSSATPSPAPGAESSTAIPRTSSAQGHTRAPSSLSVRKETTTVRNDGSMPGTPKIAAASMQGASRPHVSKDAPSSGGPAQPGTPGSTAGSLRLKTATKPPSPKQPGRHRLASIPITSPSTPPAEAAPIVAATEANSPSPQDSLSERESDESSSPAQSRIIRRPRFQQQQYREDGPRSSFLDEEDEDEAEPAFLPFRGKTSTDVGEGSHGGSAQYSDPSATLRGDPREFAANAERRLQNITGTAEPASSKGKGKVKGRLLQQSQNSDSSASSSALPPNRFGNWRQPSNPLSPRRTAELKGKGYSREGSDGAPSMGSSFSDLDGKNDGASRDSHLETRLGRLTFSLVADASVTQSALEEALASKMQAGGASTIGSTITNVFRSRYMPK